MIEGRESQDVDEDESGTDSGVEQTSCAQINQRVEVMDKHGKKQ